MATRTRTAKTPTPIDHLDGVPVYGWGQAPGTLHTRPQLNDKRRRPKPDARPAGYLRMRDPGDPRGRRLIDVALYPMRGTLRMRPLSAEELARRTCPTCGTVGTRIVRGDLCGACREKQRAEAERERRRTCADWGCTTTRANPVPPGRLWYCRGCIAKRAAAKRAEEQLAARSRRSCPDCGRRTATAPVIEVWKKANPGRGWRPRRCTPCAAVLHRKITSCPDCDTATTATLAEVEAWLVESQYNRVEHFRRRVCEPCQVQRETRAEAERQRREQEYQAERERRRAEVRALSQWARDVLADPAAVILDTETTGLYDAARIVEISVITAAAGETLLDTLINPGEPIPAEASEIHGITDAMVADAPRFGAVVDELAAVLAGRRVVIWNSPFDWGRLRHELRCHYLDRAAAAAGVADGAALPADDLRDRLTVEAFAQASAWLSENVTTEDAMIPYSDWYGEWSEYHGDYTYQRLGGDHRSRGDCLTVRVRLAEMRGSVSIPDPAAPVDVDEAAAR